MLVYCWLTVADGGPTLTQHGVVFLCSLRPQRHVSVGPLSFITAWQREPPEWNC